MHVVLPRLRFIIAALAIALLPILVAGTVGPARDAHLPRPAPPPAIVEDQERQLVLAYARRAHELDRLRELARAPLRTWIENPAGEQTPEAGAVISEPTGEPTQPPPAAADEVAALPPEPGPTEAPAAVPEAQPAEPPEPSTANLEAPLDIVPLPTARPARLGTSAAQPRLRRARPARQGARERPALARAASMPVDGPVAAQAGAQP